MKSDSTGTDADSVRIKEILRGAKRGPLDPDLELSAVLIELRGFEDEEALEAALERLARDARPD